METTGTAVTGIAIADIADLATEVADAAAVSALDPVIGGIFDYTVAIVAGIGRASGLRG